MEIQEIMAMIEAKRLELRMHKATLCSRADVTTQHYNRLLEGTHAVSFDTVRALIVAVGGRLNVVWGDFVQL